MLNRVREWRSKKLSPPLPLEVDTVGILPKELFSPGRRLALDLLVLQFSRLQGVVEHACTCVCHVLVDFLRADRRGEANILDVGVALPRLDLLEGGPLGRHVCLLLETSHALWCHHFDDRSRSALSGHFLGCAASDPAALGKPDDDRRNRANSYSL